MSTFDVAAYVWPAYHDEPRWRRFMPEGQGEWETVRKAFPKFPGHRQPRVPLWGYENEADPRVMAKKIDAAAGHGVNVFIFDWYWYENAPFLEDTLNQGFLEAPNRDRMSFYLMWANHDATTLWDLEGSHEYQVIWPGVVDRAAFDAATERVIAQYFTQPNYYRIDGKPVFAIYEIGTLIRGLGGLEATRDALDAFRAKVVAAGLPGLHLQAILWGALPASLPMTPGDRTETQHNTVQTLGIDSLTNYQWCHYVQPRGDYQAWAEQAIARWEPWSAEFTVPFYPHVSIGWDTNPRFKGLIEDVITGNTPALFADYLRQARDFVTRHALSPQLITVNAWNEWSESSYLEPDTEDGYGYLEAVKSVFGG
jgi:hypothetical protein